MRIIGIDPGPDGFAWAGLDIDTGRFTDWGEHLFKGGSTSLGTGIITHAIEDFTGGRTIGKSSIATVKTIGRLQQIWPAAILISRLRVAQALNLAPNKKRGDAQINAAMCRLYPELRGRQPGLNSHTRAACAVAHAAIGVIQERKINAGND